MSNLYGNGRANRRDYKFDEAKLRPGQREAALLLIEKEFVPKGGKRMTDEEIANQVGVSRMTIHNWNNRDRNFIEYKNYLAADFFDSYLPFVYRKLLDGISNGSMKGIELFLKRAGDLDSRSEVTINDGHPTAESFADRKAALLERRKEAETEE